MREIKIFIASSIVEFESERNDLGNYFLTLNDILIQRGRYLRLSKSENLPHGMDAHGIQERYNQEIRDSQYFYLIVGKKIRPGTWEEFETAWKHYQEYGTPDIHTYFLQSEGEEDPSVTDFKNRLRVLRHYYDTFEHFDTLKLNMLIELLRHPDSGLIGML